MRHDDIEIIASADQMCCGISQRRSSPVLLAPSKTTFSKSAWPRKNRIVRPVVSHPNTQEAIQTLVEIRRLKLAKRTHEFVRRQDFGELTSATSRPKLVEGSRAA